MTRVHGALFALCSALSLGMTARLSAAAEPTQASSARTVELTAVGTPRQQHWLEDLVGPHSAPGITLTITESDHFDPGDMLRVAPNSNAVLRCWVDLRDTTRARIYFSASAGQRFLLRDLELSGSFDDLDRESLSQVLASSWSALFDDEQLGLSREETQTLLEKRSATDTHPAPAKQTPTPTEKPRPKPTASTASAAEAAGATEVATVSLRFQAFYAANAFSNALLFAQGPGLSLSAGVQDRRRVALWLDGQYRFPMSERDAHVGVRLESIATRVGLELRWPLAADFAHTEHELGVRIGLGADLTHFSPEPGTDSATLALTPARWTTELVLTGSVGASTRLNQSAALGLRLFTDVVPTLAVYDVQIGSATSTLISPWHVRPGVALEIETR